MGNARWLPLLENYDYPDRPAVAATVSDTAMEIADAVLRLIGRLDLTSSTVIVDQLLEIANKVNYPCKQQPKTEHNVKIDDIPLEVIDWLLAKTIDSEQSSVRVRAVIALIQWLLTGQDGSPSAHCKALGINTTVAGLKVASDIYKLL